MVVSFLLSSFLHQRRGLLTPVKGQKKIWCTFIDASQNKNYYYPKWPLSTSEHFQAHSVVSPFCFVSSVLRLLQETIALMDSFSQKDGLQTTAIQQRLIPFSLSNLDQQHQQKKRISSTNTSLHRWFLLIKQFVVPFLTLDILLKYLRGIYIFRFYNDTK